MEGYSALINETVLNVYGPMLKNKFGTRYSCNSENSRNEYHRAVCYRVLIRWLFGYLGWNRQRPLPACIYHNVRTKYNSQTFTGYNS